jgi:hypothetical protein
MKVEHAVGLGRFLGDVIGEFCKCLRPGDTDGYGNLGFFKHLVLDMPAEKSELIWNADIQKGFVDGIKLRFMCTDVIMKNIHHAVRKFVVKSMIAGNYRGIVFLKQIAVLKKRRSHRHTQGLNFVAPGNDHPVIVRQDDDGPGI